MTKHVPKISEAEWEVMESLWKRSPQPQTANEVYKALQGHTDWSPKTVRTLLDRLVQKEVVGVNRDTKVYTFFPLYSQDECQRTEAKSFIQRIYGGAFKSLLVQFMEEESLSDEEINEIRSILDKKAKDK
ncbi:MULTISPECIES: penicillinase repressor BlaI [unclassified Virgibacillus]|uniref:penicillinase repressor BlaI n=1 Tax=unclassified Virgibacillus TaxID=2620237 RepID=UPI00090A66EF|nr:MULTISPECIES: penicillinase repressor BlaI [unclassified Virgibacillus]API92131.1 transcriptional regulator [Virgibacillus sp. 6R]MBS7427278.1 penicillinase repressor BlaI [Virgibacillus sp. 19R1-5]